MRVHAAVPGSSLPSAQPRKSSFTTALSKDTSSLKHLKTSPVYLASDRYLDECHNTPSKQHATPLRSTRLKFEGGGCAADGSPVSVARTETTVPASNTTPRALHSTTLVTIQSVPCLAGLWAKHCAGISHAQVNAVNWRSSVALRATDIDKGRVKESHLSPTTTRPPSEQAQGC